MTQMMMYMSPSELNFYICDCKDDISDFLAMEMPHVKKFVSADKDIVDLIRHIVKVEGVRRTKIIGDGKDVNILDYKQKNPNVDLPFIYIVIDEVLTLAERMDKETKDEFQRLLLELISRLPALGIRLFMVPHMIKDNIIRKNITDLMPMRINVMGNEEAIEQTLGKGVRLRQKLVNKGDMGVRMVDEIKMVHSVILTKTNDGNKELFEFIRRFWEKLEPESAKDSVYYQGKQKKVAKNMLESVGLTSDNLDDLNLWA
jgi:S-DNA-T family DNA segregation ATPase FtsK/SpoIIIE